MLRSILFIKENIPKVLEDEAVSQEKEKLFVKFETDKEALMTPFQKKLKKQNLTIGKINDGNDSRFDMLILIEDKAYPPSALEKLISEKIITRRKADNILKKYLDNQTEFNSIFKEVFKLGNELKDKIGDIEQEAVRKIIVLSLEDLKSKYRVKGLTKYLNMVEEDILNNLPYFRKENSLDDKFNSNSEYDYLKNYEVNIIRKSFIKKDCPVVIETSPSYQNLFGTIEKYYDGEGGWFTDFTAIKAGALLKANGGYLILNASDTFAEPGVWKALKRALYYGQLEIEDKHTSYQASPSVMKPEPIEINTKVILIGSAHTYSVLSAYEDDFNKVFKVKAEFDSEMKISETGVSRYVEVLENLIRKEKLKEFDISAISKILEYAARYVNSKNKLTTRFSYILDLAREAEFWANDVGAKDVSATHVVQAYESARERHGLYESKVNEMFEEGTMMIDTKGTKVGQINGLAVYGGDRYSFGKPTRITATVALGNGNILNVEREAGLSGSTHNKGVLVISGYLKEVFGRTIPLSFNASLVFEQGYGMIDGDSASITEIAALVSAMTEIPIKQSFAITGSVNQKGDIQPIGGVNDKIEGFYDLCKSRGLTGKEGVIIPKLNVQDLMLKDEVVDAVKEKKFSIYAVNKVEEALELLMGVKAGKRLASGHFQAHTIFGEVEKRLKEMRRRVIPPKTNFKVEETKKKRVKKKK